MALTCLLASGHFKAAASDTETSDNAASDNAASDADVSRPKTRAAETTSAETTSAELPSVESPPDRNTLADKQADAKKFFEKHVSRFLKDYCLECHRSQRPTEGDINFTPVLDSPGHAAFTQHWRKAVARVKAHDMPPEEMDQPSDEERERFLSWLDQLKYLSPKDPGPFVIRRLTKTEYANTLEELFGVDRSIADSLPDEVSGAGYMNSISPLQLEQYLTIADEVLDQAFVSKRPPLGSSNPSASKKPASKKPVLREWFDELALMDDPTTVDVRTFIQKVARRVYRRPASETEIEVLMDVFQLAKANELDHRSSLRLVLKATLVSPQFLFITPSDHAVSDAKIVRLDDHQLASRLSYFLWATMPDDELSKQADLGTLHETATLRKQVNRMLTDPRSRALFDGFGTQWLGIDDLVTRPFDMAMFPEMTPNLRAAMLDEARLLFDDILQENASVARFLSADYTFVNETLASIYGLEEPVRGSQMRRVSLADPNRGGVLAMPATLAATSFPNRTSAVNRGVWVLEQILGDHVPPAPPDVPALESQDQASVDTLTLRERTERHRSDPVCANCHKLLDPIGFGLENFDAIGRWRDRDAGDQPIDATGELPGGRRFTSPRELKAIIGEEHDAFARNLLRRLLAYALCRNLEGYDEIVVDEMMKDLSKNDYAMRDLVVAVVTSYPFTHRRVNELR